MTASTFTSLQTPTLHPPHTPQALASTNIIFDSMNLIILGTPYKWNQTVFVCNCCMLECIFEVSMSSKQIVPFFASVLFSRFPLIIYFIHSSVYMSMPVCQCIHPHFPALDPYACPLHLCFCFCFAF